MERHNNAKNLLFSTPFLKALDFLLQNPDDELNDTEVVAKIKGVKKSAVNLALRRLAELGFVDRRRRGKMVFNKINDSVFIAQFKIVSNLMLIKPLVDDLIPICSKIVLFGSRADGTNNTASDFDFFVVTSKKDRVRKIIRENDLSDKIQSIIKNHEQSLTFKQDEPVLSGEIEKGIVLWAKT